MKLRQPSGCISRFFAAFRLSRAVATASLLGLLALQICPVAHAAIPASERAVLTAFYTQTGGPGWITSTNWNGAEGTECTWYHVTCDSQGTHVVAINLPDDRLIGTLPPLDGLPFLQILYLRSGRFELGVCDLLSINFCNLLTGPIPPLSALTALTQFNIHGNSFTGTIPDLSALINLQQFDVAQNQLSGSIPALAGLSKLNYFSAGENQLTGALPELQGLTNLTTFNVESNQLSGPIPALTGLGKIQYLLLDNNRLSGPIPALAGLSALYNFDVSDNQLTGAIPAMSGLGSLSYFLVSSNQLSGSIPAISSLSKLIIFDISSNQISGSIPSLPNGYWCPLRER